MIAGEKLKAFRLSRGVTQEQIADVLGQSKQTISESERRPVGPIPAQAYLNAVEQVIATRAGFRPRVVRITYAIEISDPKRELSSSELDEYAEIVR